MCPDPSSSPPWLEWAVASRPLAGEPECADRAVVVARDGFAVLAVIDGLGHGRPAVLAATRASEAIERDPDADPGALLERCHAALAGTRGAVASVVRLVPASGSLTWAGIGDVEAALFRGGRCAGSGRQRESLVPRAGVLGDRIPKPREATLPLLPGDLLVLASDGVSRQFGGSVSPSGTPRELADALLAAHALERDDALVLVVRYHGAP